MTPAHEAMRRAGAIVVDTFLADPCHNPMPTEEMLAEIGKTALLAALRSLEADGWVCVPKIATEDMLSTGKIAAISTHRVDQVYESMVAASPRLTGDKP